VTYNFVDNPGSTFVARALHLADSRETGAILSLVRPLLYPRLGPGGGPLSGLRDERTVMSTRRSLALAVLGAIACFATGCSAPPGGERLGTVRSAGSTQFPNDQTAYDYFRAKGFTTFQAAGIVGNLDQESGVDPTISQFGGGPGRGIAQWSAGGRWDTDPGDNLMAFAMQQGQDPLSLGVQLDFIWFELTMFPGYGLAKLQASTNLTDAATDFEIDFEGCNDPSVCAIDSRISYAMAVLNAYANDPVPDAGPATGNDAGATGDDGASGDEGATGDDAASGSAGDSATTGPAGDAATAADTAPPGRGSSGGATPDASGGGTSGGAGPGAAFGSSQGGGCTIGVDTQRRPVAAAALFGVCLLLAVKRRSRRAQSPGLNSIG
jgi:hypothetical protein